MPEFDSDAVDPTLRLLYQSGVGISPSDIAANLDHRMDDPPARAAVLNAVRELAEAGLVRSLSEVESCYVVTEHGRDYVEAEVDDEAMGLH
jgi:predicted transcriptional regulator